MANFKLIYHNKLKGYVTRYFGMITKEDFLESYQQRFSDLDRLKSLRFILSDFSAVTDFDISSAFVHQLAEMANAAAKHNSEIVIVAAMPEDLMYGMGRMWQGYTDDTGWTSHVFRTQSECLEFISQHLDEKITEEDLLNHV